MLYSISIYNYRTRQKTVRFVTIAARVRKLYNKLCDEIEQHAFEVVLVELDYEKE